MNKPVSVVDYDAWGRGYMPPSEHILIDKLSYRGARVQISTPISREHQIWVVVEGPPMTNKQRKAIREMVNLWFKDEPEPESAPQLRTSQNSAEKLPNGDAAGCGADTTVSNGTRETGAK